MCWKIASVGRISSVMSALGQLEKGICQPGCNVLSVWVSTGFSGFLSQSKTCVRSIEDSKLALRCECGVWVVLCLCSPSMAWRSIQGVSCLHLVTAEIGSSTPKIPNRKEQHNLDRWIWIEYGNWREGENVLVHVRVFMKE